MLVLYRGMAAASKWAAVAGSFCALLAGLATVADILIRSFGGQGIIGTVDITQMLIVAAAFLTIPYGFIADTHVSMDALTDKLPPRLQSLFKAHAALLGCVLMAAIAYYGLGQAKTVQMMGDRSQTIGIPMIWNWWPLLGGAAYAGLVCFVIALRHIRACLLGHDDIGRDLGPEAH